MNLVERLRAELTPERYEHIMANGWDVAIRGLLDEAKSGTGVGDQHRLIAESWMMDGKDELIAQAADTLTALIAERDALAERVSLWKHTASAEAEAMEDQKSIARSAETTRDAARANFLTMQGAAAVLLKRAETAEAQLKAAREALVEISDGYGPNHLSQYAKKVADRAISTLNLTVNHDG